MISKSQIKIPRTYDPKLDAMARVVRKWGVAKRMLKKNYYNPLSRRLRMEFLALTDIESYDDWAIAKKGVITTRHVKLTDPSACLYVECRPGTYEGTSLVLAADHSPQKSRKNAEKPLEEIAEELIIEALYGEGKGMQDYYTRLGTLKQYSMKRLKPVQVVTDYERSWKRGNHNVEQLHDIIKKCSAIIDSGRNLTKTGVKFIIVDTFRRYVNSEGTVLLDYSYGIHIKFSATINHKSGMSWPVYHSLYFGEYKDVDPARIEQLARRFKQMLVKRTDCDIAPTYDGPVLLEPVIFTGELHEAMVHLMASDSILDFRSSMLGAESFGKKIAPEELSVFSDPWVKPLEWGSYLYDQEGVAVQRVPLIDNGVHAGFLADRHGAQVLSDRLKENISPGNSLTAVQESADEFTVFAPQPRIGVFDVVWNGKKYSKKDLKALFIQMLKKRGLKEGVYAANIGCPGYSFLDEGTTCVTYNAPFMMNLDGKLRTVTPMISSNSARHVLQNICAAGAHKEYVAHRCGDAESMAEIRAGIFCSGGIIDDLSVSPLITDKKIVPEQDAKRKFHRHF